MGTDVALRPEERAIHGLELAEQVFTPERRSAIAKFLNVTADEPALLPYLATCASFGLDPIMGQIWLIPQKVKVIDGDVERKVDRYRPAVGRDGYLAIAHREPRFQGLKGQVVCERDVFEVTYDGSPSEPLLLHKFASKPVAFEEGVNPERWRGRVLGAWARAKVAGQPDTFFYAPIREYAQVYSDGKLKGAWGYLSSMILKAAQSYVLRIGLGISGLVPADELVGGVIDSTAQEVKGELEPAAVESFDFGSVTSDPGLARALEELVGRANELAPLSWAPAKCEMVMSGMNDAELRALVMRLEGEVEVLGNQAAARAARAAEGTATVGTMPAAGEGEPERSEAEIASDGGQQEEVADAVVLSAEDEERIERLRARVAETEAERRQHPEGSEEWLALSAELDGLDQELRALEDPGQTSLGV